MASEGCSMKRLDQITGAMIFFFSLLYVAEALKMPMIAGKAPGAGWMPLLLGSVMLLLSALLFLSGTGRPASKNTVVSWPKGRGLANNVAILGGLVLSILILEAAGYLVSTFVFLLALMMILGRYRWRLAIPMALLSSGVLYWVFKVFLNIPLPSGVINFL